jgi:hypothetical protein
MANARFPSPLIDTDMPISGIRAKRRIAAPTSTTRTRPVRLIASERLPNSIARGVPLTRGRRSMRTSRAAPSIQEGDKSAMSCATRRAIAATANRPSVSLRHPLKSTLVNQVGHRRRAVSAKRSMTFRSWVRAQSERTARCGHLAWIQPDRGDAAGRRRRYRRARPPRLWECQEQSPQRHPRTVAAPASYRWIWAVGRAFTCAEAACAEARGPPFRKSDWAMPPHLSEHPN